MSGIFISYRRRDTAYIAGRLHSHLSPHFGAERIFRDIDTLAPGVDFVKRIDDAVGSCDALVAVIGAGWLSSQDAKGRRRIDNPRDWVRLEITAALKREILVVPVLVEGATMPYPEELPTSLRRLARYNAMELSDARWDYEAARLIDALKPVVPSAQPRLRPTERTATPRERLRSSVQPSPLKPPSPTPDTDGSRRPLPATSREADHPRAASVEPGPSGPEERAWGTSPSSPPPLARIQSGPTGPTTRSASPHPAVADRRSLPKALKFGLPAALAVLLASVLVLVVRPEGKPPPTVPKGDQPPVSVQVVNAERIVQYRDAAFKDSIRNGQGLARHDIVRLLCQVINGDPWPQADKKWYWVHPERGENTWINAYYTDRPGQANVALPGLPMCSTNTGVPLGF